MLSDAFSMGLQYTAMNAGRNAVNQSNADPANPDPLRDRTLRGNYEFQWIHFIGVNLSLTF